MWIFSISWFSVPTNKFLGLKKMMSSVNTDRNLCLRTQTGWTDYNFLFSPIFDLADFVHTHSIKFANYLNFFLSIYLSRQLWNCLSKNISVYLSIYLPINLSVFWCVRSWVEPQGRRGTLRGSCSRCTASRRGQTPARSRRTGCSPRQWYLETWIGM